MSDLSQEKQQFNRWIVTLILGTLVVGLHILFLVRSRPGFLCSDDLFYARIIRDIAQGSFQLQPRQFHNRFGLLFPAALCVRLFGMNPWSVVLWPMLCSCATVLLVFSWTTSRYGRSAGVLAGLLMAVNGLYIRWAMHVMPDVVLAVLLLAAVISVESVRRSDSPTARWGWAAAFGVAMFCSMCTRMTAIWIAPFLAVSLVIDVTRKASRPWLAITTAGIVSALLYMLMYWALTGDPLYRVHFVEAVFATGSLPDTFEYSGEAYVQRLVYEPFRILITESSLIGLMVPTLCVMAGIRKRSDRDQTGLVRFGLYALTFLMAYWFGSISLSRYRPIEPLRRYLLPVIPPMAVCGGVFLSTIAAPPNTHPAVLRPFRKLFRVRTVGLVLAVLFVLVNMAFLLNNMARGRIGETLSAAHKRRFVTDYLTSTGAPTIVYTDTRSSQAFSFYLGMPEPSFVTFKLFKEFGSDADTNAPEYMYVDQDVLDILKNLYETSCDEDIARILQAGSWKHIAITPRVQIYQRTK